MSRAKERLFWLENLHRPSAQAVLAALGDEWQRVSEIQAGAHAFGVKVGGGIYAILDALCSADLAQKRGSRIEQYRRRREESERPAGDEESQRRLTTPGTPISVTTAETVDDGLQAKSESVASTDDEELSEEEWAERRRIGLRHAYAFLDRYDEVIGEPDQPEGECGECGRQSRRRWSLGMFVLCRDCRRRRARAAEKAVVAPLPPAPLLARAVLDGDELDAELEELVRQHGGRNGNGGSPLWDEPEF
jgi:ribosomal protein L37AE/L43A